MTLFGHTLAPEEIATLVGLLMVLVLWSMSLRSERNWLTWFRRWEADRKARREAGIRAGDGEPPSPDPTTTPRGPWS